MQLDEEFTNLTPRVLEKIGRNLHRQTNHPLEIIKRIIFDYFRGLEGYSFSFHDDFDPVVSPEDNFDLLLIPPEHPSRSKSDTYYLFRDRLLRTHTSAHQNTLLAKGERSFLVCGDVYRKDEINASHYPVFHQVEGVHLVPDDVDPKEDLLKVLNGLVEHLFPGCKYRVNDDYFPFTEPSFEYEVEWRGDWLEILGCGVVHTKILDHHRIGERGWAFGLGLERLAMILFDIPDIRYFWSSHERFLSQFADGKIVKFVPYSELPTQTNDVSFWIPDSRLRESEKEDEDPNWLDENDFFDLVRDVGGEMVARVELFDRFYHPKRKQHSRAYRFHFSPPDPGLKDPAEFTKLVLELYREIIDRIGAKMEVELRS